MSATITHAGTLPDSANKADFYALIDGATITGIINAEIASNAAIVDTKLAQITTASKVSGAALTALTSIPAQDFTITGIVTINDNAANGDCMLIDNDGTGHGLKISQDGVLTSSKYALYLYSNAVQITSPLLYIQQNNASSSAQAMYIINAGTGTSFFVEDDGTCGGLTIKQDGNLATSAYALFIDNNGTPTDGAGKCIRLDGCTTTTAKNPESDAETGFISVNIDGTPYAVPYYAIT